MKKNKNIIMLLMPLVAYAGMFLYFLLVSREYDTNLWSVIVVTALAVMLLVSKVLYIIKAAKTPPNNKAVLWTVLLLLAFLISFIPFWFIYYKSSTNRLVD